MPSDIKSLAENFIDSAPAAGTNHWEYVDVVNAFIGGYKQALLSESTTSNETKRGNTPRKVSYPTGKGVLIVEDQDVNGVVVVRDDSGRYVRVSADVITHI